MRQCANSQMVQSGKSGFNLIKGSEGVLLSVIDATSLSWPCVLYLCALGLVKRFFLFNYGVVLTQHNRGRCMRYAYEGTVTTISYNEIAGCAAFAHVMPWHMHVPFRTCRKVCEGCVLAHVNGFVLAHVNGFVLAHVGVLVHSSLNMLHKVAVGKMDAFALQL